ncbi:MAG: hypothetical protein A2X80_10405 [Geobacteraceae bacterium GWB2_52_12]|nr:MAG: hypothetical protein A2X80_10405 [Geobacteraceae bacterium GWB2_52_12]
MFPLGLSTMFSCSLTLFLYGAFELLLKDVNLPNTAPVRLALSVVISCFAFSLLARESLMTLCRQLGLRLAGIASGHSWSASGNHSRDSADARKDIDTIRG